MGNWWDMEKVFIPKMRELIFSDQAVFKQLKSLFYLSSLCWYICIYLY